MKINIPIQSLWIGPELSVMEVMCIKSYLFHGHEFHLYVYENIKNVPPETIIKDANEIISQNEICTDSFGGFVNFSNQFRYELLYKVGGWWVDMDTVCLKPFCFKENFVFSSETLDPLNRYLVNTTFIKSLPRANFLKDCINYICKRGYENIHWGELGVNLISRSIFRNNMEKYIKSPDVFCPISAYQLDMLISESDYQIQKSSFAIHWWNELWRRKNIDKNMSFDSGSIFENMKKKYLINI